MPLMKKDAAPLIAQPPTFDLITPSSDHHDVVPMKHIVLMRALSNVDLIQ